MTYPSFLKETDKLVLQCDADALRAIIHELARTLPEQNRDRFLEILRRFTSAEDQAIQPARNSSSENSDFASRVDEMIKTLEKINAGERSLGSELNEEWDDWYDSEDTEFIFSDSENILDDLSAAFNLIHQCIDREDYEKGAELAVVLAPLKVNVDGEYSDYSDSSLDIETMISYSLLDIPFRRAAAEAAYLVLAGSSESEKASFLYLVLSCFRSPRLMLENILQIGSREIAVTDFLPAWIAELGEKTGAYELDLLLEAQDMIPPETALANAKKLAEKHPALLEHYLLTERDRKTSEELLSVGLEALTLIPVEESKRASVALLTAEYALAGNDPKTAEECWLEAFCSDPSVINFLRLLLEAAGRQDLLEKARIFCGQHYENPANRFNQKPYATILFLDGQFRSVLDRFMKAKEGIGWSSTFMKEGLALFLLLLNSGRTTAPGLSIMVQKAQDACHFTSEDYLAGLEISVQEKGEIKFNDLFQSWKETVSLDSPLKEELLRRIDQWIQKRVAAIMNANRRNYYGECAAYIAAFGEVRESMGEKGAKAALMEQYRVEYSRRRAFHDELRRFGMRR